MQTFTAPVDGVYKLEVWGAQGGGYAGYHNWLKGAKGGYSKCKYQISSNQVLYIVVGESGGNGSTTANSPSQNKTYNGGGAAGAHCNGLFYAGAGGGASHIATTNKGELKDYKSNQSELLIVAGGGGGTVWYNDCPTFTGGVGGGLSGGNGISFEMTFTAYGGTQTDGYEFGQGQDGLHPTQQGGMSSDEGCGGGGGGYFGGKSSNATQSWGRCYNTGGGGGSGHINTTLTTNGTTIAGDQTFSKPGGGTETGHEGDGYAIISWISPSL